MHLPDLINGTYECLGGIFLLNNCLHLYKDREIKGVSLITSTFFCSWGYWNLWYYPYLNQWMSFVGGCLVVIANTLWILMAIYYQKLNRSR